MPALATNFLNILKDKLEKDFIPHLPELLNKERPKADQDKKQLSRAFSGFVLHKMLNVGITDAAKSVVDDFDDNGLDAIHYEATSKTLYLVQTKFREREQFDEGDAIRFRSGADLLLGQRYDRFNANVQCRKDELDDAFDEAERIQLVVAYIGTGFSVHANAALKELGAYLLGLERDQYPVAVFLKHLAHGMALSNCMGHVAPSTQLCFNLLRPLLCERFSVKRLGLRREALEANLDVICLLAVGVDAFSNAGHMFLPSRLRLRDGTWRIEFDCPGVALCFVVTVPRVCQK
ncbi:hypothetical protein SKTS_12910 [Sulfurimicrobium lacus]|uniref:Uncharacterized protein n=1 Tax=Sulfurimicrobium lacus TaxID=2715678 RepID=A0A6F8VCC0_9PROT|nr:hypothetical protein [Sulfurimicrobium lacus]BCB26405.1 hypothetical protein SKTS_12910 [Sulfurimicrobium lacus]